MARSNVNTGFAKCFISFMAIVILLEGCVYLGLAIWGITQQSCSNATTNIADNPFNFIIRFIYFQREECGPVKVSVTELADPVEIYFDWAKSFLITNRMNIFLITYTVVSAIWIVTSLLVLASICGPVTKTVAAIAFWPWFLIVIAGSVLDAVVTGYSIYDIIHTTTALDTFQYVGADYTNAALMNVLKNFDAYFMTPAVVMTIIGSRVVVIWLLNIFGTGFCLSLSQVLAKNNNASKRNEEDIVTSRTVMSSVPPSRGIETSDVQQDDSQYSLQQPQSEMQTPVPIQIPASNRNVEQRPPPIAPKPLTQNPTISPQPQGVVSYSIQQPVNQTLPSAPSPDENVQYSRPVMATSTQPRALTNDTTYRNTETHPDRLNYPVTQPVILSQTESTKPQQNTIAEFSTETPLNSRYTGNEGLVHPSSQPQRVSAELRSQLPWSYTSLLGKPQPPRKPEMKVYPEIPEPDYVMSPNKPGIENNSESSQRDSQQGYSRW